MGGRVSSSEMVLVSKVYSVPILEGGGREGVKRMSVRWLR